MRCTYASDLHLEKDDFDGPIGTGDVLILAGDLFHARTLAAAPHDRYATTQRDRARRFLDRTRRAYQHVVMVAGNHEHRDGVFEDTNATLRQHLDGITVLDDAAVEIGDVAIFGTTLWTDFEGRSPDSMERAKRTSGDFVFIRRQPRADDPVTDGAPRRLRFRPDDALAAHDRALAALDAHLTARGTRPTIVVSHHAPSPRGLNPLHRGRGTDGVCASNLEPLIALMAHVPFWIHGHTHVRSGYEIAGTRVVSNARGIDSEAAGFAFDRWFEV